MMFTKCRAQAVLNTFYVFILKTINTSLDTEDFFDIFVSSWRQIKKVTTVTPTRRCLNQQQMWKEVGFSMTSIPQSATVARTTSCVCGKRCCSGRRLERCLSRPTLKSMVRAYFCTNTLLVISQICFLFKKTSLFTLFSRGCCGASRVRRQCSRFDLFIYRTFSRRCREVGV